MSPVFADRSKSEILNMISEEASAGEVQATRLIAKEAGRQSAREMSFDGNSGTGEQRS